MNKKLLLATCLAVVGTLVFVGQSQSGIGQSQSGSGHGQTGSLAPQQESALPEHVQYMFLFRHLSNLIKQANEHQRQGKDGSGFQRRFKNVLVIDEDQFGKLNEITLSCELELANLDRRAKTIIEAFRARYPEGEVPQGVIIPPPPEELIALREERNNIILRARNRVREAMGEREFARFDEILELNLTPNIKRAGPPNQMP